MKWVSISDLALCYVHVKELLYCKQMGPTCSSRVPSPTVLKPQCVASKAAAVLACSHSPVPYVGVGIPTIIKYSLYM